MTIATPAEIAKKLTPAQVRALTGLRLTNDSAYGLRVTMNTMEALNRRSLVVAHDKIGWMFSPSTCAWRITPLGIAVLAALDGEAK